MSDIQPTEADREEAKAILEAYYDDRIEDYKGYPRIQKQLRERHVKYIEDLTLTIARIRAEAVKAERERCIVNTMQLLVTHGYIDNSEIYNAFRAKLEAILSDDQEARNG